jgi:hypothetical protein
MMQDRIDTLERISGLEVRHHNTTGVNYFMFKVSKGVTKTVCTYRKARVFAEGVATGRELGK